MKLEKSSPEGRADADIHMLRKAADRSRKTDHVVKAEAGDPIDEQNEGAALARREIRTPNLGPREN